MTVTRIVVALICGATLAGILGYMVGYYVALRRYWPAIKAWEDHP